ncbi:MAG: CpsD/CapB family tyrosine-protein kinase [Bacillus sp. (in: Bacteria)]|nr:CpsD/CapB family tyrosine-protein kinase [Bacillus sp. (in: firmicutes)]
MFLNKRRHLSANQKRYLVAYSNPDSLIAEQFRTIQTNIHFLAEKGKKSVILITSPSKGEGKSITLVNIAVSMAQQKKRVLVIDANLRDPALHSIFKLSNKLGLTDVLTGKSNLEETVHLTDIGRLEVLTSGAVPFNPTELLSSDMLGVLFLKALENYDIILVDSTGVLEVADTKVLANKCDGVILVIGERTTATRKAIETKKALEFAQAKLIGVILNEIK